MKKFEINYITTVKVVIEANDLKEACSIAEKKAKMRKNTLVQSVLPIAT